MAIGDSTRVNTNIAAFNALSALKNINRNLEKSQLKLATGLRINEVSDDPAGFVLSRRLIARSKGLSVALDNVGTAKNVLSIAEGGLLSTSNILLRMKELVTQAASDTLGSAERAAITSELTELTSEVDDIVSETEFNSVALINGTYTGKSFQTGEGTANTLTFSITQNHSAASLIIAVTDVANVVTNAAGATGALIKINTAIDTLNNSLQTIGATISRLSVKENTLSIAITNTEATKSRILDVDIAREQLESTRFQILQQTATAQLAQANIIPQNVLALFT